MRYRTLITVDELAGTIDDCVVFDCRHDLADAEAGERGYAAGHIPSAQFLHLDRDLSGVKTGVNGRHPLPQREVLHSRLEAHGVSDSTQVVAYDAQGGVMASRLWALLRWLGHEAVAVLDGGLPAWQAAGYPLETQATDPQGRPGRLGSERAPLLALVDADTVAARIGDPLMMLLDARDADRFAGRIEPIDPVAGHIPGAVNRHFARNLRPDGRFKPAEALREELNALLAGRSPSALTHQCGSGVTACHNLLAMTHAGLAGSALYAGSWSEWVSDPLRPVARDQ